MKKLGVLIASAAFLLASGCATKEYVKSEVTPLSGRLDRIEARLGALEGKLAEVQAKEAELSKADRAALQDAVDAAKRAGPSPPPGPPKTPRSGPSRRPRRPRRRSGCSRRSRHGAPGWRRGRRPPSGGTGSRAMSGFLLGCCDLL